MLDQDFCEFLEYEICRVFKHSDNPEVKGFWCDGIVLSEPENRDIRKFVNDNKQIIMTAFIGKSGQTEYELTLKFGVKALSRFVRKLDIKDCVPNPDKSNWFYFDTKNHKIEIQLD